MVPFSLSSEIRESVKASMEDRPLDMMVGPPTTEKMDAITEQLAKSMAGVRINAAQWAAGKFGCLPLALEDDDLKIATNRALVSNAQLTEPATIHPSIVDDTKQKDLLRLTKVQDERWAAYHIQDAAIEIGVSMLVANVEAQYLVEINKQKVGFRKQAPLTILAHLTKT